MPLLRLTPSSSISVSTRCAPLDHESCDFLSGNFSLLLLTSSSLRLQGEGYTPSGTLYNETWIAESHAKDPTSHFLLVTEIKSNALVAYSRFSFVKRESLSYDKRLEVLALGGQSPVAVWLQVTVITAGLRGQTVAVDGESGKISDISFERRISYARSHGCNIAFCDVVTSPIQNLASLRYIARHGLREIGEAERIIREGKTVIFTRFATSIS